MVWMVKTSDGAEGEARNWREVGGEVLRCGGYSIAKKRTRWPSVPSVMVRRGEVRAAVDGVDGEDIRRSRRRGEELARGRRHPSPWFSFFLPCCLLFSLPRIEEDGEEDEAVRMADRRGAALLLVVGRSAARCGDVVAIASHRSGRGGRPSLR